jgi:hypothetical protein
MMALVTSPLVIRAMGESDPEVMSAAFAAIGWRRHKPRALFQRYLADQEEGRRLAFVAEWHGEFSGYVTLLWTSEYGPFAERQVPEVADLNVLPRTAGKAQETRCSAAPSQRPRHAAGWSAWGSAFTRITALRNGSTCGAGTSRTGRASCTATSR